MVRNISITNWPDFYFKYRASESYSVHSVHFYRRNFFVLKKKIHIKETSKRRIINQECCRALLWIKMSGSHPQIPTLCVAGSPILKKWCIVSDPMQTYVIHPLYWWVRPGASGTGPSSREPGDCHPCKCLMLMVPQSSWEIKTERKQMSEFSKTHSSSQRRATWPTPAFIWSSDSDSLTITIKCHKPKEVEFTHTAQQLFSWHSPCITHVRYTGSEGRRGDARGTACLLLQRASRCPRALESQIKQNPVHVSLERNKHGFVHWLHFFILYSDAFQLYKRWVCFSHLFAISPLKILY